jgi:hypothetical protein
MSKKAIKRPHLSPVTLLRPRLDGLLQNEAWIEREQAEAFADLDAVCKGIAPTDFLPILTTAVVAVAAPRADQVSARVGEWLFARNYLAALAGLVATGGLHSNTQSQAAAWLRSAGYGEIAPPKARAHEFAAGFYGKDEFGSQGLLMIFWYVNQDARDVTGLQFLLDYNPPWYGAVKDVMKFPRRPLAEWVDDVQMRWSLTTDLRRIDAVETKMQAIRHLENNRVQGIRLHRDLIALRDVFVQEVLGLPDGPETPPFDEADFGELCTLTKQTTEAIMHFEKTVARQVVMPDGKILFVDAALANEPD